MAGVASFKDTDGDATAAAAWIQADEDIPTLLNGYDTLTFPALAAGVRGVVWGRRRSRLVDAVDQAVVSAAR